LYTLFKEYRLHKTDIPSYEEYLHKLMISTRYK
jgi:hypothetical protein